MADPNILDDGDIQQVNGNNIPLRGDDDQDPTPTPNTDPADPSTNDSTEDEELGKEKISILKSNFAKYLKLTRDGYTLADLIKIYGIDNDIKFGLPVAPKELYTEQSTVEDGAKSCFDTDEESPLGTEARWSFFEGCTCTSTDQQGSTTDKPTHSVENCEQEIKDGVTFADFMLAKEAKFFEDKPQIFQDNEKVSQFLDKYHELNNDEWKLNPEDDEKLANGGHQFYFNLEEETDDEGKVTQEAELNIPRDLEQYAEYANIPEKDIEDEDANTFLSTMIERMKEIFGKADPELEEEQTWYADFFTKLMVEFLAEEGTKEMAYYNQVGKGVINPEKDVLNGETFVATVAAELAEAARQAHENPEYADSLADDVVRGMILKYARADGIPDPAVPYATKDEPEYDLSFNRFLRIGFGAFLGDKFGIDDQNAQDLVDFIFNYQYHDAMLRKLAMDTIATTDPGKDYPKDEDGNIITPEHYQIDGFDKVPVTEDYEVVEDGLWVPEYKVSNIEDGVIPTEEKPLDDLAPNWIDPANVTVSDDGKQVLAAEQPDAEWAPFKEDTETVLGGDEKLNLEVVDGAKVHVITDEVEPVNPNEPVDPADQDGATGYDSNTNYNNPDQDVNLNGNGETVSNGASITGNNVTTNGLNITNETTENVEPITITAADTASVSNANISSTSPVTISSANGTTLTNVEIQSEGTTSIESTNDDVTVDNVSVINSSPVSINANDDVYINSATITNSEPVIVDADDSVFVGQQAATESSEPLVAIESTVLNITSGNSVYLSGTETSGDTSKNNATISINMKGGN